MQVLTHMGNFLFGTDSRGWKYDPERGYFQECDFSGTVCISDEDVDAIVALRKVPEECVAAHEAWERRRFLNETSRELFADLYRRMVHWEMSAETRRNMSDLASEMAAEGAADLLCEVESESRKLRDPGGLDVS